MSTKIQAGALGVLFLLGLGVTGCVDPVVVNTAPPGLDPRSIMELPKEEESQAIGETGNTSTASVPAKSVISTIPPAPPTAKGETKTTASGTKYETIKEGSGTPAKGGQRITVHYVGKLDDGRKFDSSRDKGRPETFTIGTGHMIKGWDEAVPGMLPGEVRKLIVPPSAGYGALGRSPQVPPNAELSFEIELISAEG